MRKALLYTVMMAALLFGAVGQAAAQEADMIGTWTVFRVDELANYTMRDHTEGNTEVPSEGVLVIEADGGVTAQGVNFSAWRMEAGFFVLENQAGNHFYAVRSISPDVLFLTSLTVTERNREVTHIRMNRGSNLLIVRQ